MVWLCVHHCLFTIANSPFDLLFTEYDNYAMYEEAATNLYRAEKEYEMAKELLNRRSRSRMLRN